MNRKSQVPVIISLLSGFLLLSLTFFGSVVYLSRHFATETPDGKPSEASATRSENVAQEHSDTVTILLTASSVLLVVVSLFVAVLAIFGWAQIKEIIETKVEKAMEPKDKTILARSYNTAGISYGYVSIDSAENVLRPDLLYGSVEYFGTALKLFEEAGETTATMRVKNNLAYFLAIKYRFDNKSNQHDQAEAKQSLRLASDLPSFYEKDRQIEYLLSYARVLITCGHLIPATSPQASWREEVKSSLERIKRGRDLAVTALQRETADRYLQELNA